jgi:hypothetical protein
LMASRLTTLVVLQHKPGQSPAPWMLGAYLGKPSSHR